MKSSLIWDGVKRNLPPDFFLDHPSRVAPRLLGKILIHQSATGVTAVRLTEVEAYDSDDPASHSCRGKTERNRSMFLPGGCLYIYLIYGIHECLNIVTEEEGCGSAVLLRAGEPLTGDELMWKRRFFDQPYSRDKMKRLTKGPGNLCRAMGFSRKEHDGMRLSFDAAKIPGEAREAVFLLDDGWGLPTGGITASKRVGITKGTETLWRFSL